MQCKYQFLKVKKIIISSDREFLTFYVEIKFVEKKRKIEIHRELICYTLKLITRILKFLKSIIYDI